MKSVDKRGEPHHRWHQGGEIFLVVNYYIIGRAGFVADRNEYLRVRGSLLMITGLFAHDNIS